MKILALELSSARGSVASVEDANVVRRDDWPNDRRDSAPFFAAIDAIAADVARADIIVVGLGPGSYAGTRIAISAAVGLQFAWGAQLVGYASLRAYDVAETEYWAVGDARRDSYFVARIRDRLCVEGPSLCTRREFETRLPAMADVAPVYSSETINTAGSIALAFPRAELLAELARANAPGRVKSPLEPLYLREPHITQPKAQTVARTR